MNFNQSAIRFSKLVFIILLLVLSTLPFAQSDSQSGSCEIGLSYLAVDGLTVTLNSLTIIEKTGSYEYSISYTLENRNMTEKILEGSFKMYLSDETGGTPQYGFFNYLFPEDTITRSYTFEELKSSPFSVLEYHHDHFFTTKPISDSLQWDVLLPDDDPPIIRRVFQIPGSSEIEVFENMTVGVDAFDEITGIDKIVISYKTQDETEWINIDATYNATSSRYEADIHGQTLGSIVRYEVIAYDKAGNYIVDDNNGEYYLYRVLYKITTSISGSISKSTIFIGDDITFSGLTTPGISQNQIMLYYTRPDDSFFTKDVTTDSEGKYSDSYVPDMVGTWISSAIWLEDSSYTESTSQAIEFTVDEIPPTGNLSLLVQDINDNPLSEVTITSLSQPNYQETLNGVSDDDGFVTFNDVNAGNYMIQATRGGFETTTNMVQVLENQTDTQIIQLIPQVGNLDIFIMDVDEKLISEAIVSSSSQPNGQSSLNSTTGDDGLVKFIGVKPGSYTFHAEKSGYLTKSRSLGVTEGETAELIIIIEEISTPDEIEENNNIGIPGFPYLSIIFGLVFALLLRSGLLRNSMF